MRKLRFTMLVSLAVIISGVGISQKITLLSGDLDFLKEQTIVQIEYDYGNGDMDVGKYENEADYIKDKIAEKNEDEPGSGDIWYEAWVNDRKQFFQPRFEMSINNYFKKKKCETTFTSVIEDSKYKMVLKTTTTEPGFNVGISARPAWINVEVIFVETQNPEKVAAKLFIKKAAGTVSRYSNYSVEERIAGAYGTCGLAMAKFLYKKVYK